MSEPSEDMGTLIKVLFLSQTYKLPLVAAESVPRRDIPKTFLLIGTLYRFSSVNKNNPVFAF